MSRRALPADFTCQQEDSCSVSKHDLAPSSSLNSFKCSVQVGLPNLSQALISALSCFTKHSVDVSHIESQENRHRFEDGNIREKYVVHFQLEINTPNDKIHTVLALLRHSFVQVQVLDGHPDNVVSLSPTPHTTHQPSTGPQLTAAPWSPLRICIIGFGSFGQFVTKTFVRQGHSVRCVDIHGCCAAAAALGCEFHHLSDVHTALESEVDVVLFAVSIMSFEKVVAGLPKHLLRGKLVVDVLSVKVHARDVLLRELAADVDIVCTHPMFGPVSGKFGWHSLPLMYDQVRVADQARCEKFLAIWESEGCAMIKMSCTEHDQFAARTQFLTHLTGRALGELHLQATPIDTRGYQALMGVAETTCADSFDLFFGLYHYNAFAREQVQQLYKALEDVNCKLRESGGGRENYVADPHATI